MEADQKLAALANRCRAPDWGPEGVCTACCFARQVTTRIAANERDVQATRALCSYRQKVVAPLLELHEVSNPGLLRLAVGGAREREQLLRALAESPPEERLAFDALIETLYEQHLRSPPP